jgi:hypothetical protein
MDRPFRIEAGSAARAAAERSPSEEAGLRGSGPLRLAPRASSTPTPEAVPREQFKSSMQVRLTRAVGRKLEQPAPPAESAPPAAQPAPAAPARSLKQKLLRLFGWGRK